VKMFKKPAPQRAGTARGAALVRRALKLIDNDPIALELVADVVDVLTSRSRNRRR
jgi:hypothetical protein